ncbi:MAG: hypothetical protein RIF32_10860, partial [Leptospirales bacterium]
MRIQPGFSIITWPTRGRRKPARKPLVGLVALLILILPGSSGTRAEAAPGIQAVADAHSSTMTLDTPANPGADSPTWWVSTEQIDPGAEFERLRSAAPGRSGLDRAGPAWQPVVVPGNLVNQEVVRDGRMPVWYRKVFFAPASGTSPLVLRLGEISDRDQVYLNGQAIGATGVWDAKAPQGYDKHRLYTIPDGVLRKGAANLLLIHVKGFFPYEIAVVLRRTP